MKQYIYGKNPIMEALKGASVYKIYMLNGHKDPKIFDICKRNQIPLEFVDKKEFDKKVGKVVHQGVMAYIENYRYYTIDEILKDIPENKQPLLLMLDGLEDPHNLGAILRTCDAVGVDGVIIGKNRSVGLNGTVAKVSTGAIHHVKVAQVERTNIRNVTLDQLAEPIEFFSVDVSFISLHHIFPVAQAITTPDAMGVCLVKPQFEAGREKVGKNGVVRDPATHREVLHNAID